jgi:hypothetical protein
MTKKGWTREVGEREQEIRPGNSRSDLYLTSRADKDQVLLRMAFRSPADKMDDL